MTYVTPGGVAKGSNIRYACSMNTNKKLVIALAAGLVVTIIAFVIFAYSQQQESVQFDTGQAASDWIAANNVHEFKTDFMDVTTQFERDTLCGAFDENPNTVIALFMDAAVEYDLTTRDLRQAFSSICG